jgi:hypothetical protein
MTTKGEDASSVPARERGRDSTDCESLQARIENIGLKARGDLDSNLSTTRVAIAIDSI